jgi:hypothetical protein
MINRLDDSSDLIDDPPTLRMILNQGMSPNDSGFTMIE